VFSFFIFLVFVFWREEELRGEPRDPLPLIKIIFDGE